MIEEFAFDSFRIGSRWYFWWEQFPAWNKGADSFVRARDEWRNNRGR